MAFNWFITSAQSTTVLSDSITLGFLMIVFRFQPLRPTFFSGSPLGSSDSESV